MKPIIYEPKIRRTDLKLTDKNPNGWPSAWQDIPTILQDIINRFELKTNKAIEFGVEYGYSTSALANHFSEVIGIDTFLGDIHSGIKNDTFNITKEYLKEYENIKLIQTTYQDYILKESNVIYDFAHVDIIHTYEDTYSCGEWCIKNADVVVFHDTMTFPGVYRACSDLAKNYGLNFYNYEPSCGLGILTKKILI